ncbi:LOW QUALITY PROTEIN: protein PEAK3 [Thomomys bottae]
MTTLRAFQNNIQLPLALSFRLLNSTPCAESENALYYVVRMDEDVWHVLATKLKPRRVELQASLPPHFNLQGLCGLLPESTLPVVPWRGPATPATEVQRLEKVTKPRSEWAMALVLLQMSSALEFLEEYGVALAELRPENLLLAEPRGCAPAGPLSLLLADFGHRSAMWLQLQHAVLLMPLAECAVGGQAPGLHVCLCCENLTDATEISLRQTLVLLWTDPK